MDIEFLISLAKTHSIDTIHPGYGFLSESAEFSRRLWHEAGVHVIGPGWEILEQVSDKLQAKALAAQCDVPVLPSMGRPSSNLDDIKAFADETGGYPIIIKAVDGGGGRGIRLVRTSEELPNALERAQGESPSKTVFVEKAAVDGFHHVEVQIIGDGSSVSDHASPFRNRTEEDGTTRFASDDREESSAMLSGLGRFAPAALPAFIRVETFVSSHCVSMRHPRKSR